MTSLVTESSACRTCALIDSTSAISFVVSRLVNSLRATKKFPAVTEITCFQQTSAPAICFKVDLTLKSIQDSYTPALITRAAVVDTIAGNLPDTSLSGVRDLDFLLDLQLADPEFDWPGRIDRVDVFAKIWRPGNTSSEDGEFHALNSVFCWLVTGTHHVPVQHTGVLICLKTSPRDMQTHQRAFWEVEEVEVFSQQMLNPHWISINGQPAP